MSARRSFFSSSVGSKYLIAFTGISLVGFLAGHLAGNLLIYVSPEAFNAYGESMINNPLLVPAELGLLAIFLLHVYKTVRLFFGAREARPVAYAQKQWAGHTSRKSWASTTMILSGAFLFLFVPFHLKTFKYGTYYEAPLGGRDLWRLVAEVFSSPGYVIFYTVSMVIVGFHLWHGVSSALQSVGIDRTGLSPRLRLFGWVVAAVIAGGFLTIPLYLFLFGARS